MGIPRVEHAAFTTSSGGWGYRGDFVRTKTAIRVGAREPRSSWTVYDRVRKRKKVLGS